MAPFRDQLTEVRREAAQERERLEAQARQARQDVAAAASRARTEATESASRARQEAEERARQAEQDLRTQAVAVQASIRKAQSEAERVAEARKAEARKAEAIERRKVDLPGIRPRDLGTAEFISTVDAERKRAHTEGRSARAEVDKEREKLGGQIEEAREAAFADIDKQKGVIDVDLAKAVAGAMFDIEEQHALLLTGVKEWEEDSTAAVKKAEAEYNKAVTEFEAAHIELDTGEVVAKAEFEALDETAQDYIKRLGIEAGAAKFNTEQEAAVAEFEAAHVEVDGEWFVKSEWEGLTAAQQAEVKEHGYYTEKMAGTADPLTGSVVLFGKELPEGQFKQLMLGLREALRVDEGKLTGSIFGIKAPGAERTAAQVNKFFDVFAPQVDADIRDPAKFIPEMAYTVGCYMPVIGTALTWKESSTPMRALNLAIDAAIVLPIAMGATRALRMKVRPITTQTKLIIATERKLAGATKSMIAQGYGKAAGANFDSLVKAQGRYLSHLARIEQLKLARRPNAAKIATLAQRSEGLAVKLEIAARRYATSLRGKAGFDAPTTAKLLNDLPTEVVQNARATIEGLVPTVRKLDILRADLTRANQALKAAQAKWPTAPNKWTDLLVGQARAQSKLDAALAGDIGRIHGDLIRAREAVTAATTREAQMLARVKVMTLEEKLRGHLKGMEVEWGQGGFLSRGGIGVGTQVVKPKAPAGPTVDLTVTAPTQLAPAVGTIMGTLRASYAVSGAEIAKARPMIEREIEQAVRAVPAISTTPAVIAQAEAITAAGVDLSMQLHAKGIAAPDIETRVRDQVDVHIEAIAVPEIKGQLAPHAKSITHLALQTATRVKVATKAKPKPKLPVKPKAKIEDLTPEQRKGAVAWKQGFIYKLIYPPYGQGNVIYSRKPFKGIRTATGARSAYKSIARMNGEIPKTIKRRMGIMDVTVTTKEGKRPKLEFVRRRKRAAIPRRPRQRASKPAKVVR